MFRSRGASAEGAQLKYPHRKKIRAMGIEAGYRALAMSAFAACRTIPKGKIHMKINRKRAPPAQKTLQALRYFYPSDNGKKKLEEQV